MKSWGKWLAVMMSVLLWLTVSASAAFSDMGETALSGMVQTTFE